MKRVRLWFHLRFSPPFSVRYTELRPDMCPVFATSKGVKSYTLHHRYWTPIGVWRHDDPRDTIYEPASG